MKKLIRIHQSSEQHWVGNGFLVRSVFSYNDLGREGSLMAMRVHGLETPLNFVQSGDPKNLKFVESFTYSNQLDAVFCASDHIAAPLLQSLNRLGLQVPKDLKLVGFANVPFANLLTIPLNTMDQPCRDIAVTAIQRGD